jgi:hypothetical protein
MVEREAHRLANEWSKLYGERWSLGIERRSDTQRSACAALARHMETLVPDAPIADVVLTTEGSPRVAVMANERLLLAWVSRFEPNEAPEVEIHSLALNRERCDLEAAVQMWDRRREATWRLSVEGELVVEFCTSATPDNPSGEALPRAIAAAIGWQLPGPPSGSAAPQPSRSESLRVQEADAAARGHWRGRRKTARSLWSPLFERFQ